MIWLLKFVVLLGGRNFARKALVSSSHVVMHPEGKEWSHALALSLNEKGNNCNLIASVETPVSFSVAHTFKNTERCMLGSSSEVPLNWDYCTMEIRDGLSSKLWTFMLGRVILEAMPWTPGVTKSRSIVL